MHVGFSGFLVLSVFFIQSLAAASPGRVRVDGDLKGLLASVQPDRSLASPFTALPATAAPRLAARIVRLGRVRLELQHRRDKDWQAYFVGADGSQVRDDKGLTLFRGRASSRSGLGWDAPLAASSYRDNNDQLFTFFFQEHRAAARRQFLYRISLRFPLHRRDRAPLARFSRIPARALRTKTCSTAEFTPVSNVIQSQALSDGSALPKTFRSVNVALESDYEFYERYGASSNARAASVLNAALVIYERDLGVTFQISNQRTQTSSTQPFTSTDPVTLLTQLSHYLSQDPPAGGGDITHLYTGKVLDDSVAGIAYRGVICAASTNKVGITQDIDSLSYLTTAHEIGHNFNATHDTSDPASVMYPVLGANQDFFSATSIVQINDFLSTHNECLRTVEATPVPTATPTTTPGREGSEPELPSEIATPTTSPTPVPPSEEKPRVVLHHAVQNRGRFIFSGYVRPATTASGGRIALLFTAPSTKRARLLGAPGGRHAVLRSNGSFTFRLRSLNSGTYRACFQGLGLELRMCSPLVRILR